MTSQLLASLTSCASDKLLQFSALGIFYGIVTPLSWDVLHISSLGDVNTYSSCENDGTIVDTETTAISPEVLGCNKLVQSIDATSGAGLCITMCRAKIKSAQPRRGLRLDRFACHGRWSYANNGSHLHDCLCDRPRQATPSSRSTSATWRRPMLLCELQQKPFPVLHKFSTSWRPLYPSSIHNVKFLIAHPFHFDKAEMLTTIPICF